MISTSSAASASQSPNPWVDRLKPATFPNGLSIWKINHQETEFLDSEIFQQDLYLGGMLDQILALLNDVGFEVVHEQQADGSEAGLFDVYGIRR